MSEPKDTNEAACGGSALTAELGAWLPIETASKRPWDFVLLAWGPEEDKSTGVGCFRGGEWIAAAVFYCMNKPRGEDWEFRETVVTPTHWMPRSEALNPKLTGERNEQSE